MESRAAVLTARGRSRLAAPAATALLAAAGALALQLRDPHRHGAWGRCPFRLLTGWDCPGCGGLRAVADLGNGDVVGAVHDNLLVVASVPVAAVLWLLWVRRAARGLPGPSTHAVGIAAAAYVVVALVFAVVRNTPWGSGLYAG